MTRDRFHVDGDSLSGRGLAFDVAALVAPKDVDPAQRGELLVEIVEVAYRQGQDSARLSCDDRFDLHCAVEVLRALAVVVGPIGTGERYRRAADVIARLLHEQQGGA